MNAHIFLFLSFFFFGIASFEIPALQAQHAASRSKISLNELWEFQKQDPSAKQSSWEIVNLPHSWNTHDVMTEERGYFQGLGHYRKTFRLNPDMKGKKIFLYFEGANQMAEVQVNGQSAGTHLGGYTAFCFDISSLVNFDAQNQHENTISVKVDNRVNPDLPPLSGDFTFSGGLYRDVYLLVSSRLHFDVLDYASSGVYLETPELSAQNARLKVRGRVVNDHDSRRRFEVVSLVKDAAGRVVGEARSSLSLRPQQSGSFEQLSTPISNPHLWSPESPYLYSVSTQIIDKKSNELVDEVVNPLGFRWFTFDPEEGFSLNGKPYKLIGANRHQDFEGRANAMPDALHERDMRLIKDMGGNFVRIAHYPQDPALLAACDRLGLIAWEEIPIVNAITETEAFARNSKEMLREMIRQHYNHPSILMWGYMNEVLLQMKFKDDPERQAQYIQNVAHLARELEDEVRREDPNRTTVMAFHGNFDLYHNAGITQIPMVLGWNLYYGWYSADFLGLGRFLDQHREVLPDKLIIVSEYGAGSDTRLHAIEPKRFDFTEQWQQMYLQSYLRQMQERPFVVGGAVWNLVDFNSEGRKDTRPHINQKGLVQWDRTPKDVYYFHQAALSEKPVLHIASTTWNIRSGRPDAHSERHCTQPVQVYSNAQEVELLVNGRSIGKKKVSQNELSFEVPFRDGMNRLEAVAMVNGQSLHDVQKIDFRLQPYELTDPAFRELNVNLGAHHYFVDHELSQVWVPEKAYEEESWGYVGGKVFKIWNGYRIGSDKDILGTRKNPLYQTQRDSLQGFRFDVADGTYELSLHFAELLTSKEREALVYNLGAEAGEEQQVSERVFDVLVNGEVVLPALNPAREYGELRAAYKKIIVKAQNNSGVVLSFRARRGNPILNAIQLKKLH